MTKRKLKHNAQDRLMGFMALAFCDLEDEDLTLAMDQQMRRVEKLFGYDLGSFVRGG